MASANATKNDISLDEIFNAIDLPTTNVTSKNDTYEGHTHTFYAESNVGNVTKNIGYQASEFVISNVGNTEKFQNDYEDTRSEISRISKATSVSVHSSVSQKSANHYDLPPIPQYDVPPVVKDNSDESSHHSEASSKNSSKHSVHTHDSESTITNGTLVNEPIVVGEVASTLSTPVVVGKSTEHDAVIEQFKKLHEKEPSLVPESHHELESESEDSIAPNTLTKHQIPTLVKAQDLETIDFKTSNYSIPPSNKGHLDNESENSFGFEHVEYKELNGSGSRTGSVAHFTQVESLTEQTYHSVYKNHDVPTAVFDEDINHHSQHQNNDYYHHDVDQINVKTSRSNTASTQHTHQSSTLLANSPGPKITEELRPATVVKETETHIEPPILAYVAPVPTKPPRHQSEKKTVDAYDAYGNEEYQVVQNVIKDSTVVHEDIRHGPGVHELRLKFDNGVQPPLAPVLLVKKMEEERNAHNHQHHHHHQHHQQEGRHQTEADQIQKVSEHVQLGGSRKSSVQSSISDYRHPQNHHHHHHHHHENKHEKRNDVPSRPSGFSNSVENKSHSRTSSVSTVKSSFPIQRVLPTVHNNYGDHLSVRVVKNVRQFVVEFDPKHPVPPPAPFAGTPKLSNSPRTPISPKTFEPLNTDHQQLTHRKSVSSIGGGVKPFNGSRKSSVASTCSSRSTIVGGNIVSRSRQSTITKENVDSRHQKHDANDDEIEIIRVNEVRKLFEKFGPTSLPEYASLPSAYLH